MNNFTLFIVHNCIIRTIDEQLDYEEDLPKTVEMFKKLNNGEELSIYPEFTKTITPFTEY